MTASNLNILYTRQRLFWRCLAVAVLLLASYLYLVNSAVFNLVARERLLGNLNEMRSNVVALESEYLALSGQVTMELARERGFHDATASAIFVELPTQSSVVALAPAVLE